MGLIAFALAAALAAGGAEPLQPSSDWGVDYADNSCTLSRSFGTGDDRVSLGLMPQTGGERMRIVLAAKNRDRFAEDGRAKITIGDGGGGEPLILRYYSVIDPRLGRVALMRTGRVALVPLDTAKALTIDLGGTSITLAVSQVRAAMKALAACEADLARSWGVDPSAIATPPAPLQPQRWITNADYPTEALRRNQSGETSLRVAVDAAGKPVSCAVTDGSGSPVLDKRSCDIILQRGRFKPAIGTDGKPIAGLWATNFIWWTPDP